MEANRQCEADIERAFVDAAALEQRCEKLLLRSAARPGEQQAEEEASEVAEVMARHKELLARRPFRALVTEPGTVILSRFVGLFLLNLPCADKDDTV